MLFKLFLVDVVVANGFDDALVLYLVVGAAVGVAVGVVVVNEGSTNLCVE